MSLTFSSPAVPAGGDATAAYAIDPTGKFVVGRCRIANMYFGCMWDGSTWTKLGNASWAPSSVSTGGTVVVGSSNYWSDATGLITIGDAINIRGVTPDGNWIVGMRPGNPGTVAFRWSNAGGFEDLGDLPGGSAQSDAYGVSADGSVVTGYSVATAGSVGFRWTKASGLTSIGDLLGGNTVSYGLAINPSGDVIVGESQSGKGYEAFRWTQLGGMVALGIPPGLKSTRAKALSQTGDVVVGSGATSFDGDRALIYTATGKLQLLSDVLTAGGVDLTGWTLSSANGISHDGHTIVGYGTLGSEERAFIVTLP